MSIKTDVKDSFKNTLIGTGYFTGVKCAPFWDGINVLQKIKMPYCFFALTELSLEERNRGILSNCKIDIEAWFKLNKHTEEDVFDACDEIETLIHTNIVNAIKSKVILLQKFKKLPSEYIIPDDVYGIVSIEYEIGFMCKYNNFNSINL